MSADECRSAEWRTVGYEDGRSGSAGRIGDHSKACAKVGIAPNLDQYELGRADGLRQYCIPSKGYEMGSNGHSYNGVCPEDLEPAFVEALEDGRVLYRFEQAVSDVESEINDIEHELDDDEGDLRDLERKLVENDGNAASRQKLLDEIKQLTRDAESHRISLVELNRDLYHAEQELEEYRELLGDGYR